MNTAPTRIKIAQLINYVDRSGKEMGILKLLNHLNTDIFDTTLVVVNEVTEWDLLNLEKYKLAQLDFEGGNSLKLPFMFRDIFRDGNYDIVHTRSWVNLVDGVLGARLARVPIVIHQEHGTFPQEFRHRIVQPIFWGWADRVLSVSGLLAQKLSDVTGFATDRIDVVLNGVDDSKFYPDPVLRTQFRTEFGFSEEDLIIGTVGRLNPVKNLPMLLRATAHLKESGQPVKLVLTGIGQEEQALRELADSLAITDNVFFLGLQQNINMILNGYDIFSLTSFSEGCSNVIQEAMFAQKSIVATRVGGNPELITDEQNGFLVESDNHIELADRFAKLISDDGLSRKLAENARESALARFSLRKMVQGYERIYIEEFCKHYEEARDSHLGEYLRSLNHSPAAAAV